VRIEQARSTHLDDVTRLALKLWPEQEGMGLRSEFEDLLASDKDRVFLAAEDGNYIGFLHMSLRFDYVEGSSSSPVGYVEGIYVDENHRNQGVSKKLVEAGAAWAKSLGCKEMGSDTELDNHESQAFHKRIGFREAGRIVAFIKTIDEP
jgi:aminoglycoside 6'-N-acetyltransferase I